MARPFAERRAWFDEHVSCPTCPCCGYATLDPRGAFEIGAPWKLIRDREGAVFNARPGGAG